MTESQDTGPRTENQQSRPGPQLNVTKVVAGYHDTVGVGLGSDPTNGVALVAVHRWA